MEIWLCVCASKYIEIKDCVQRGTVHACKHNDIHSQYERLSSYSSLDLSLYILLCPITSASWEINSSSFTLCCGHSSTCGWPRRHSRLTACRRGPFLLPAQRWSEEEETALNETPSILMKHNYFSLINHWKINMSLLGQVSAGFVIWGWAVMYHPASLGQSWVQSPVSFRREGGRQQMWGRQSEEFERWQVNRREIRNKWM